MFLLICSVGYNEARDVFEELVTDENRCWPTFLDFSYKERRAMQVVCVFCDIVQELLVFLSGRLSPRFRRPSVGAAFAVGWMSLALACCSALGTRLEWASELGIGRVCLSDVCRLPPDSHLGVRNVCASCPIGGVLCIRWLGPGVECW